MCRRKWKLKLLNVLLKSDEQNCFVDSINCVCYNWCLIFFLFQVKKKPNLSFFFKFLSFNFSFFFFFFSALIYYEMFIGIVVIEVEFCSSYLHIAVFIFFTCIPYGEHYFITNDSFTHLFYYDNLVTRVCIFGYSFSLFSLFSSLIY